MVAREQVLYIVASVVEQHVVYVVTTGDDVVDNSELCAGSLDLVAAAFN